uniref:3-deoxy-D-manno-octulosonate 8-phosphate phosphatase KdsC n=1 Tax=Magnetococcus massalia (strain MO-1) TaxID=451514 RepID=A0A1S7LQF0_MAGMO|nr:3-deoxy-D-manno-octulosonate 8-phosphate phosphatase [Candidatus Magnetococcus massalia]
MMATAEPWQGTLGDKGRRIRLIALDVDGVLTDGGIYYGNAGEELKRFHVRDGLGVRLMVDAGIQVGVITARRSELVARRAKELGMTFIHQGVKDKWHCFEQQITQLNIPLEQCGFMGDDLIDLPILTRVGLATTPADGHAEVKKRVDWVAPQPGGNGAVRALADQILQLQGHWDGVLAKYDALP